MKARCPHGAPWFAGCPWCEEPSEVRPPKQVVLTFPFWRIMSEADARAYLEQAVDDIEYRYRIITEIRYQLSRAARQRIALEALGE